jgi:hypothetical protein
MVAEMEGMRQGVDVGKLLFSGLRFHTQYLRNNPAGEAIKKFK